MSLIVDERFRLNYWRVLVSELEVIYNYSGVKNFRRKIRKKKHPPPSISANCFSISNWILADWNQQSGNAKLLRFLLGNEIYLFWLPSIDFFKKKGITKNNLCDYTPTNKFARLQPIALDIFLNLLNGVLSLNWFIKFLLTFISLQRSETVLFLSLSSFFMFSIILFFKFMCLFGRILCYSCVCSGQIYTKHIFFGICLTELGRVQTYTN